MTTTPGGSRGRWRSWSRRTGRSRSVGGFLLGVALAMVPGLPVSAQDSSLERSGLSTSGPNPGRVVAAAYYGLAVIDPDEPDRQTLIRTDAKQALWSPDGRSLLLSGTGDGHVYLTDWSGLQPEMVPIDEFVSRAWWGVDSEHLVWVRSLTTGFELVQTRVDGSEQQVLLTEDQFDAGEMALAPDGSFVVVHRIHHSDHGPDNRSLHRIDLPSGNETVLAEWLTNPGDIDVSPDGQTLAYRHQDGLWSVPTTGGGPTQLVSAERGRVRSLAWSPDGGAILYSQDDYTGGHRLRVLDLTTSQTTEFPPSDRTGSLGGSVDWQPLPGCTVIGTEAADVLSGTAGDDVICAGSGDDTVGSSAGHDVVLGGPGTDRLDFAASPEPLVVDIEHAYATAEGGTDLLGIEAVRGTSGADIMWGGPVDEAIDGGAGDDTINGGGGADALNGGTGTDDVALGIPRLDPRLTDHTVSYTVDLAAGAAIAQDGTTDDVVGFEDATAAGYTSRLVGTDGPNHLHVTAGTGPTLLVGRGGDDLLEGWTTVTYEDARGPVDADLLTGRVSGAEGADTLVGTALLIGSEYGDRLVVDEHPVYAGSGDDWVVRSGFGETDAGTGDDVVDLTTLARRVIFVQHVPPHEFEGSWSIRGAGYERNMDGVERLHLTDRDDIAVGTRVGGVRFWGHGGDDRLRGSSGDDVLVGGAGLDAVAAGEGNDTVRGGADADRIRLTPGDDLLSGGGGFDMLDLSAASSYITVDLRAGHALGSGTDLLDRFEGVRGSTYDDILLGSPGRNDLNGRGGSDVLQGRGGNDRLKSVDGGVDRVDGGSGHDDCRVGTEDAVVRCP